MDLAAAQHADDVHGLAARLDDLGADLHADLVDHAQDVALGHRGVRPHDEIRPAQDVEVDGVVGHVEGRVEQLAQLLGRGRRIDVEDRVAGLGRGHVVRLRADAADARGDVRHLLHAAALGELLEPAQLGDHHVRVGHVARIVQKDVNPAVAFQAGDRINADLLHIFLLFATDCTNFRPRHSCIVDLCRLHSRRHLRLSGFVGAKHRAPTNILTFFCSWTLAVPIAPCPMRFFLSWERWSSDDGRPKR